MFIQKGETINHILSECKILAQTEYSRRHDNMPDWSTGDSVVTITRAEVRNGRTSTGRGSGK